MRRTMQQPLPPMELERVGVAHPTHPKSVVEWRATVGKSLGRAGLSQKAAAADLGITEQAFSKQLAGTEHLSFWRMFSLPREFWQELVLLIIDFYDLQIGLCEQDRRDLETGRAMRELVMRVNGR